MNWTLMGSLFMLLAVALGAFGAHGLKNVLSPERLQIFEVGVRYQVYHALALFVVAAQRTSAWQTASGWFFVLGIILFSMSLYAYAITHIKTLAMITPIGGFFFLLGWGLLIIHILKHRD